MMDISIPTDQIWMVVLGFVIAFVLAFGIGANDVANSFGTSVGSKVLTLRQACILASVFETLGAVLLGAKVSDTIRKGVITVDLYQNETMLLMTGNIAALSGSCVWMIAATLLKLPVSATHSIVGATIGFALVNHGSRGIQWTKVGLIIGSWFVSPLMAGLVSTGIFFICKYFILNKDDPLESGLRWLPVFYAFTVVINAFSVFYEGPEMLRFDRIPLWGTFVLSFGSGIICAVVVRVFVVPYQRTHIKAAVLDANTEEGIIICSSASSGNELIDLKAIESSAFLTLTDEDNNKIDDVTDDKVHDNREDDDSLNEEEKCASGEKVGRADIADRPETVRLFSFLQILTAVFGSFAHGGNDVSNAISPVITLWIIATTGEVGAKSMSPIWILVYGGAGISLGLCLLGRRVIKTMGEDLAKITPSSGFCIEIGSALTVLIASNIGVPISTTHCKVGSVVFVGRFRSRDNVDWSLFRNIVLAWLVTLPITGGISAAIMAGLRLIVH